MAGGKEKTGQWGCLFVLGGIGILAFYLLLIRGFGGEPSLGEKWGFPGIAVFCILLGLFLFSRAAK